MSIFLDLAVLALIIIFIIGSAKKGFVSTVVEVVGFIAALALAFSLSTPIANYTYDTFIEKSVEKGLSETAGNIADASANSLFESLPDIITENAENFGISVDSILNSGSEAAVENNSGNIEKISNEIVKPIAVKLIGMVATIIIFLVLSVVVKMLARILNKLFSFSIIGKLNTALGGVVGLLKGLVIATIICVAITLIINLSGKGFWIFTPENINSTYLFKYLSDLISI